MGKIVSAIGYFMVFGVGLYAQSVSSPTSQGKTFAWKLQTGDVLELNEFHNVRFRVQNDVVLRQDKNRIALKVDDCSEKSCGINGQFVTYVRYGSQNGPFRRDKTYESRFFIQPNGLYEVPEEYAVPNLRSVPGFPDRPIQVGEKWTMPAEESFDFQHTRIRIPVQAQYQWEGTRDWQWMDHSGRAEKIAYSYTLFHQPIRQNLSGLVKIYGMARGEVYFDSDRGMPQFKETRLSYTFVYANGSVTEASFHIHGIYNNHRVLSEQAKIDFQNKLEKDLGIHTSLPLDSPSSLPPGSLSGAPPGSVSPSTPSGLQVRRTDEGVVISMDSILFDTDKSELKKESIAQIEKIAEALRKNPNREVRISGHTDNVGGQDYNQKLSEERAKSVLNALVENFRLDPNRLSYQGFGDRRPIAPNSKEEGRRKNRRVDITIVLE